MLLLLVPFLSQIFDAFWTSFYLDLVIFACFNAILISFFMRLSSLSAFTLCNFNVCERENTYIIDLNA